MVGQAVQDYLKAIFKLRGEGQRVGPTLVAERLSVSAAAVTKMLRRLQELRLVTYERNQEILLTPAGEKIALEVIRHHRLLETYLAEALGYTWDQVDGEAEKLEHVISEEFEEKIDRLLGFPTHDPHGDPIPSRDLVLGPTARDTLDDLQDGSPAVVHRVTDGDPEMLRYLGSLGLYPRARVEVMDRQPYGGPIRIRVDDRECSIGRELAQHVFVGPEMEPRRAPAGNAEREDLE